MLYGPYLHQMIPGNFYGSSIIDFPDQQLGFDQDGVHRYMYRLKTNFSRSKRTETRLDLSNLLP
jgi:hypothetical protein